jgi:hypothetical protein
MSQIVALEKDVVGPTADLRTSVRSISRGLHLLTPFDTKNKRCWHWSGRTGFKNGDKPLQGKGASPRFETGLGFGVRLKTQRSIYRQSRRLTVFCWHCPELLCGNGDLRLSLECKGGGTEPRIERENR